MVLGGSCHCGALTVAIESAREPRDLPVRVCGCALCRALRPRYTSDPEGRVTLRAKDEALVSRYRFGLRLADFLVCRRCGVFVAAYEPGDPGRAVVNLETLERAGDFVGEPSRFTAYDSEDATTRSARRARNWTPATFVIGPAEGREPVD